MGLAAAAIGLLAFGYRYLSYNGFPNDHFVHLATAQQMMMGELPVRDYVERGIPLMSALSALAQAALGEGLHTEVVLIAAAFAAAASLTFLTAVSISGSILIGAAAAAVTLLVHPVSYSYPKLLAYAAVFLAGLSYCRAPGRGRLAVLALGVVAAFLFRHDHGVILGAGVVAMLLVLFGPTRAAVAAAGRFAALAILFVMPYLLWVQAYEGLGTYVDDGIALSQREAERSMRFERPTFGIDRTRPLLATFGARPVVNVRWGEISESALVQRERAHYLTRLDRVGDRTWQYELGRWSSSALKELVRDPAVADTHGIDRQRYRLTDAGPLGGLLIGMPLPGEGLRLRANALAGIFYLSWILPGVALVALALYWKRLQPPARAVVAMAVVVQVAMNASMLRDPLDLRIRDVVTPLSLLLAFLAVMPALAAGRMLRWTGRLAAAALLLTTLSLAAALGPLNEHLSESRMLDGPRGVGARRAELRDEFRVPADRTGAVSDSYRTVVSYLSSCTTPDARVFAPTFAPELFFYSRRAFAGGMVSLIPGTYVTERHSTLMLERLRREDVPLVILDSETEQEIREGHPRIAEYLAATYHGVGSFPISGDKRLIVLAENGRTPVRTFGPDGMPCYTAGEAAT